MRDSGLVQIENGTKKRSAKGKNTSTIEIKRKLKGIQTIGIDEENKATIGRRTVGNEGRERGCPDKPGANRSV